MEPIYDNWETPGDFFDVLNNFVEVKEEVLDIQQEEVKEEVRIVVLDEDDSEGEELNPGGVPAESQPRNLDRVKGLQPISVFKKKAANKAKQAVKKTTGVFKEEEMTPAQLKAHRRELEENSDMMISMSTFGIKPEDHTINCEKNNNENNEKTFDEFSADSSRDGMAKLANRISTKLLQYGDNLHYTYLVTEISKNLCTVMSVEEIAEVIASMEVVKNAKRVIERGGKKKKVPAVKTKIATAKEDMIDNKYDSFF